MGAVWRFSKGGAVAAGDELARRPGTSSELWDAQLQAAQLSNGYQISSGRFMSYYLIAMAIITILTIIGFIVGCMWLCYIVSTSGGASAGSRQKSLNRNNLSDDDDETNPLVAIHGPGRSNGQ